MFLVGIHWDGKDGVVVYGSGKGKTEIACEVGIIACYDKVHAGNIILSK